MSGVKFSPGYAGVAFPRRGFKGAKMGAIHFIPLHQADRLQRGVLFDVADQITQHANVRLHHLAPVSGIHPGTVKNVGHGGQRLERLRTVPGIA